MTNQDEFADAIESGDVAAVERLVRQAPELVNSPQWTPPPLHCAVLFDQPEVAAVLLDHGADMELRDADRGTTPLRYAIVYCKKEMITLLLARGANTGPIVENGTTALQLAVAAANGAFEEFADLPKPVEFQPIVEHLKELGVT